MAHIILSDYSGKEASSNTKSIEKIKSLFEKGDDVDSFLRKNDDFFFLYNLNRNRANILLPCFINKNDECLEILSGTGIVSEAIISTCKAIDCIEPSKIQSEVNSVRNKAHDNLSIYVGDVKTVLQKLNKKYDKIFVFEGLFKSSSSYGGESREEKFLSSLRGHLKDGGSLFIAEENKYGMKQFNGAKDGDSIKTFDAIEGDGSQFYSSVELRELIKKAGFSLVYFYYPLPDHRFANTIYSEDFLPKDGMINNVGHSLNKDRSVFFNEDKALIEASRSGLFEVFTNSFLIKVGK